MNHFEKKFYSAEFTTKRLWTFLEDVLTLFTIPTGLVTNLELIQLFWKKQLFIGIQSPNTAQYFLVVQIDFEHIPLLICRFHIHFSKNNLFL